MAPLILLMFVLHPLRHLIKAIIGIALSLAYYSTDITIYFIEKLMSSINWAGKRGAWLVVSVIPILVCSLVGESLFSSKFLHPAFTFGTAERWLISPCTTLDFGLAGGAFVGGIIGGATSV